eukprot:1195373-Prorocentrum_minimum.AAC.3
MAGDLILCGLAFGRDVYGRDIYGSLAFGSGARKVRLESLESLALPARRGAPAGGAHGDGGAHGHHAGGAEDCGPEERHRARLRHALLGQHLQGRDPPARVTKQREPRQYTRTLGKHLQGPACPPRYLER